MLAARSGSVLAEKSQASKRNKSERACCLPYLFAAALFSALSAERLRGRVLAVVNEIVGFFAGSNAHDL